MKTLYDERVDARILRSGESAAIGQLVDQSGGIINLIPTGIPRTFLVSGNRIGYHPDERFAFGLEFGEIAERWICSDTQAENGPQTREFEGVSLANFNGVYIPIPWILQELGERALGKLFKKFGGKLGFYNKLFDFLKNIPWHLHQVAAKAFVKGALSQIGKEEGYKHLPNYNNARPAGDAQTWFGLRPGTTKAQLFECLRNWHRGNNGILSLSAAFTLSTKYNWYIPSDYGHGPGAHLTEEPQEGSDVFAMLASVVEGKGTPWDLLIKNYDPARVRDASGAPKLDDATIQWIVDQIDLELNCVDPLQFRITPMVKSQDDNHVETWEVHGAKQNGDIPFVLTALIVPPGKSVTVRDPGLYSAFCVEGHGTIGTPDDSVSQPLAAPRMLWFGQPTDDEYLVLDYRAREGVKFTNRGRTNLEVHRCFGCNTFPASEVPLLPFFRKYAQS